MYLSHRSRPIGSAQASLLILCWCAFASQPARHFAEKRGHHRTLPKLTGRARICGVQGCLQARGRRASLTGQPVACPWPAARATRSGRKDK